jgi:fatty acid desaturase
MCDNLEPLPSSHPTMIRIVLIVIAIVIAALIATLWYFWSLRLLLEIVIGWVCFSVLAIIGWCLFMSEPHRKDHSTEANDDQR